MNFKNLLTEYDFPENYINALTQSGIETLHPPQIEAVKAGILEGNNVIMAVPTASGKTLIAELTMLKSLQEKKGQCLYIAPLKALASEKYKEFKTKYEPLGIQVALAIGDLDSPASRLDQYDIIIATAEKVDSLLRNKAQWLINSLGVMVLDEIHFINDDSRGPTMEILASRIKQLNDRVQILGLSATVSNAEELSNWIDGELAQSDWRPIPLSEGVFFNDKIMFENGHVRVITEESNEEVNKLVLDTVRGDGQTIVFVNSRRSTQAVAKRLTKELTPILTSEEQTKLNEVANKIDKRSDVTAVCKTLATCIRSGSAFHHAGLHPKQRELIEDNFKAGLIKCIAATPTLAAGVNLPARRVIVRDCKRYASGMGSVFIPTSEYKQCAGRAGRPQFDDHGEAILMAKSHNESNAMFERFIEADAEPVTSKLGDEATLRKHVLASIAGGYVTDVNGMFDFLNHTFLVHQKQTPNLLELVSDIFDFLHEQQFIEKSGFRYFATHLGNRTSSLYIDPVSAIVIREGLKLVHEGKSFSNLGLLHLVCCCPDSEMLSVGKKDYEDLDDFAMKIEDELFLTPDNAVILEDHYTHLAILKTIWMLRQWIDEDKEEIICEKFNVGPGDIYRHVESSQWLLYTAEQIAQLLQFKELTFVLDGLRKRVRYGIKEELLSLANLKGVGRIRARLLFNNGFHKPADFKFASVSELANIKGIGSSVAQSIMSQA